MTWSNRNSLGGAGNGISSVYISHTTSTYDAVVGRVVLTCVAVDNADTVDGATSLVNSVDDSTGGNNWIKIAEFTNGQGVAADGCTVAAFMTQVATQMNVGTTITATLSTSTVAKAISSAMFTISTGSTASIAGTVQTLANDAAPVGSMAISGLTSGEYLFVRASAGEVRSPSVTALTSGYSIVFSGGVYDSGADATSMSEFGEYSITTGTGSTSAPTSASADWASVFFALQEVQPTSTLFFGAGV